MAKFPPFTRANQPKAKYAAVDKNAKPGAAPSPKPGAAKAGEPRPAAKAERASDKIEKAAAKPAKADARGGYREPHGRASRGHGGHSGSLRHLGEAGRDGSVAAAEHHGYKHTSEDR